MEITREELEKLFTFQRDGYYGRWSFGMDPLTNWPISVDVVIKGGWTDSSKAEVTFTEHVGPNTRRSVTIPLHVIFDIWPTIHRLLQQSVVATP